MAPDEPAARRAPREPVLDADDIQGDSLAGFRKNHQYYLFFRISDLPAFRVLLSALVPQIATLREVAAFNELYRLVRSRRGAHRTGLTALWTNIAFTHDGLRKLTSDQDVRAFSDRAFTLGLAARAGLLGDTPPEGSDDPTAEWHFGGVEQPVDGVLVIGGDDADALDRRSSMVEQEWTAVGAPAVKVCSETCHVRCDLPGHEHFGFRDDISQPGVRGRLRRDPASFLTPRSIDPSDPRALRYARPGQRLVWPGEFVLGLPTQPLPPRSDLRPGRSPVPGPRWARNGSFLVIRRLSQDVAAFREFVEAATAALRTAGADVDAGRVAAMLVGRWPSGAPLARAPTADDPALGADDLAANDFGYENAWLDAASTTPPPLLPDGGRPDLIGYADGFPAAEADGDGIRCPYSAHVRKINPRDQATDIGGPDNTLHRRILRRGIPFGPPYADDAADAERGLMFASYQASITDQFEFLITRWVNSGTNPRSHPGGMDLLIGGKPLAARTLVISGPDGGAPYEVAVAGLVDRPWVTATGGGYFFAPSVSTIADVLAAPPAQH